jgi:uncharacterized membrane protein
MRKVAVIVLQWLHQVALSLWLGGMLVLGAIGAPAVFRVAKDAGHTDWSMELYRFAGTATGIAFGRFNYLALAACGVMLLSGLAYGALAGFPRKALVLRAALTLAAGAVVVWLAFWMFPEMLALRAQGRMAAFDQLHRTYSAAYQAQALLLFVVIGLTGWLHLRHVPVGKPSEAPEGAGRRVAA